MVDIVRRAPDRLSLGSLFEDFLGGNCLEPFALIRRLGDLGIPLDVVEDKDKITVKAELPGMEQKDIQVDLNDGVLTVKGEKRQETEEKDKHYHLVERTYGSYSRSLRLPSYVDGEKIKATYKDGVLNITLPKKEEAKPKKIDIEVK